MTDRAKKKPLRIIAVAVAGLATVTNDSYNDGYNRGLHDSTQFEPIREARAFQPSQHSYFLSISLTHTHTHTHTDTHTRALNVWIWVSPPPPPRVTALATMVGVNKPNLHPKLNSKPIRAGADLNKWQL